MSSVRIFAPVSSKAFTIYRCPALAARWQGVRMSCVNPPSGALQFFPFRVYGLGFVVDAGLHIHFLNQITIDIAFRPAHVKYEVRRYAMQGKVGNIFE